MNQPALPADGPPSRDGVSRRTLIKTGAAGGALVWAVPAIQVIGMSAADAASGDTPPPPPPPPPPPGNRTCVPSNGLLFFSVDGTTYGVKISESGSIGRIPTNNQFKVSYPTSWADYSGSVGGGLMGATGSYLVVPSGATFVAAWVADGNPTGVSGGGDTGHDFVAVTPDTTGTLVYTKVC